jgi:inosine-uridine nucleoside N-ribohydrolase
MMKRTWMVLSLLSFGGALVGRLDAQTATKPNARALSRIIVDTDIGDDVDDAFALALALRSPEIELIGITTAWGDTALRARLANRLQKEAGAGPIPVLTGVPTESKSNFTQADWAREGESAPAHLDAAQFLLDQAKKAPGELTLVAIGPLTNIGAAIDRDAEGFRRFKRVVLMGGSIRRGYGDRGYGPDRGPEPEYNIFSDVKAAQKLFASGVPIFMMPLDSTQLLLDEDKRTMLFSTGSRLTNALAALYFQWVRGTRTPTATLFDAMAVAYVADPGLCPVEPFHISVDGKGFTRPTAGTPNASACLSSDSERFFHFLLPRLMGPPAQAAHARHQATGQPSRRSARVLAYGKSDGQAHTENVDDDANDHEFERKGISRGLGERNDHALHKEINSDAVQDAGDNGVVKQKAEAAAGNEENCGRAEGDDKMERQAE